MRPRHDMLQVSVRQRKAVLAIMALYLPSKLDTTDSLTLEDTGLTAAIVLSTNHRVVCRVTPHSGITEERVTTQYLLSLKEFECAWAFRYVHFP